MIRVIEKSELFQTTYYLSLIMLQVKLENLYSAMMVVKKFDNFGKSQSSGLDFLLLLVDVDKLFDLALAMYDKQLVLRVLEKSKKDPKEFLPLINNKLFKGETEHEIRFNIDDYLGNFEKALTSLHQYIHNFEEVYKYVRTHSLYKSALVLYLPESSNEWTLIATDYAGMLQSSGKYLEAACLFVKCKHHLGAFDSFCTAKKFDLAVVQFNQLNPKSVPD